MLPFTGRGLDLPGRLSFENEERQIDEGGGKKSVGDVVGCLSLPTALCSWQWRLTSHTDVRLVWTNGVSMVAIQDGRNDERGLGNWGEGIRRQFGDEGRS